VSIRTFVRRIIEFYSTRCNFLIVIAEAFSVVGTSTADDLSAASSVVTIRCLDTRLM